MKISKFAARLIVAAGLSAVAGVKGAAAADTSHGFAVHGVGALSCADMMKAMNGNQAAVRDTLASWMLGYVSAVNRAQNGTYDATPVQDDNALVNMVLGVCSKNADARVETVVYVVFKQLQKAEVTTESPEVEVTVGKSQTVLRQATLLALEKSMVARKLLKEADANGKFNASVQAALTKFQTEQKMPVTGLPDPATVIRALVEMPVK